MAKKKKSDATSTSGSDLSPKAAKKLTRRLEDLVATAQDAAARAEKAAKKARKQRKRVEAAAETAPQASQAAQAPQAPDTTETDEEATTPEPTPEPAPVTSPAATEAPKAGTGAAASTSVPTSELASATRRQLLDLARDAGIPGRSRMSKDDLVAVLGR